MPTYRCTSYGVTEVGWFGPNPSFDEEAGFGKSIERMEEDKGTPTDRPELSFFVCDLGALELRIKPDIVMMRDVLFHIPPEELRKAINSFAASGATYLLTTTFLEGDNERSVTYPGDFFPINLLVAPYSFPSPDLIIPNTESDVKSKAMGLWKFEDLTGLPFLRNEQPVWNNKQNENQS